MVDGYCNYCGASGRGDHRDKWYYIVHHADCPIVEARRLLGIRPLGSASEYEEMQTLWQEYHIQSTRDSVKMERITELKKRFDNYIAQICIDDAFESHCERAKKHA